MNALQTSQRSGCTGTRRPLESVRHVLDSLITAADSSTGLWPSCLSLEDHRVPRKNPGLLTGQRDGDRSWSGCNLMHDLPTLRLLYALDELGAGNGVSRAANAYLSSFFEKCIPFETGLFPWGEHAFWDLVHDRPGNSAFFRTGDHLGGELSAPLIHDHLRQAPPWFWSKVREFSPSAMQRFADGLDRHWIDEARTQYNRHACMDSFMRLPKRERSCDFPRHSGHYIVDLACAYLEEPRNSTRASLERYAAYWWNKSKDGYCLPMESYSPKSEESFYDVLSTSQTLSLGVSLLDAAAVLHAVDGDLSRRLFLMGENYCLRFLKAPHQIENHIFVSSFGRTCTDKIEPYPIIGSFYGIFPLSQAALLCCAAYRHLNNQKLLEWAQGAAATTLVHLKESHNEPESIPALDIGLLLELCADLTVLCDDKDWLDAGLEVWPWIEENFFSHGLVHAVAGGSWYEAQQGSSYLLHGAGRLGVLAEASLDLGPEYSAR